MLGKQAWRLSQSPSTLWSQLLKGLYFPQGDLWKANRGPRPSWGWQSVLVGRDAILPDLKWIVGDGKSIHIRQDHWLSQGSLGGPENRDDPHLVADLINQERKEWNEPMLNQLFE